MTNIPDIRNEAAPEFSTAQAGASGMEAQASVNVPEEIRVALEQSATAQAGDSGALSLTSAGAPDFASGIVMVETREAHNLEVAGSNPAPATNFTDGVIFDEELALATDEGQNSSNAWRLHKHVQYGLDRLARRVEGVLVRNKVVEPELAEVGQ